MGPKTESKKLKILFYVGVVVSLFHVYTSITGALDFKLLRSIHVYLMLILAFLNYPLPKKWNYIDKAIIALNCIMLVYTIIENERIISRIMFVDPMNMFDIVFGGLTILIILEANRRVVGRTLSIITSIFFLYALFGHLLPGKLGHYPVPFTHLVDGLFLQTIGIFGTPVGVSATYAFLFILFGEFLVITKTGDFFLDLSTSIAGRSSGGPAKVAVISSCLLGTITGNAVANVYATGSFSIPLMKKVGYKSEFAAGVEAAASTGGMILPPIMGTAAFVMAEFVGVRYIDVALAAALPAVIYYISVFSHVHFRAKRRGLEGLPEDEIPNMGELIKSRGYLALPIIVITVVLLLGYTPIMAASLGILTTIICSFFNKDTRLSVQQLLETLSNAANNAIMISVACAAAGIVMGSLSMTGSAVKFVSSLVSLFGSNLEIFVPILTAVACIILGMGLPITAAYIIVISTVGPVLIKIGIPDMATHMFVVYFATLSAITPPVALASYAAASIAKSNSTTTGIQACAIALGGFLVPFVFMRSPELLLEGNWIQIIYVFISAAIGIISLVACIEGHLAADLKIYGRLIALASGIFLLFPITQWMRLIGFVGICTIILLQIIEINKAKNLQKWTT